MDKSKITRSILFTFVIVLLVISPVLAFSSCPKGKTFCDHPCRDYVDADGNAVCDRIEANEQNNISTDSSNDQNDFPNSVKGSTGETDSLINQGTTQENTASTPGLQANTDTSVTNEPGSNESSGSINSEDEGSADEEAAETDNSQKETGNQSNPVKQNFLSALTEPVFLVMLILMLAAFLLTQMNDSISIRLGFMTLSLAILGFYFKGCMCPVGVLANLPLHLTGILTGQYMLWLLLFLLPIIFLFFAGRIYCSGVCPLGAAQELLFRIGTKLGLNQGNPGLQKLPWLGYLKYLSLLAVLVITPIIGIAWWCEIDPFYVLFNFSGTQIASYLLIGLLVISLLVSRPWCRFLCPYGALLGILNKDIALLKPQAKRSAHGPLISHTLCRNCGKCARTCPVNAIKECRIDLNECIHCGECSQQCKLAAIS